MPLEFMLRVMRDPREPASRRDEMAKAAAPYLHPKMQATAPSIDDDSPLVPVINLTISRAPANSSPGSDKQVATRGVFRNPKSSELN